MRLVLLPLIAGLVGCSHGPNGYKIVSYSQPANEPQPEFVISHKNVQITAKCDNYNGSHVGCDQLKKLVGSTLPETKMRYTFSGDSDVLVYSPDERTKDCGQYGPCEFLRINKVQIHKTNEGGI
jgi:hypothetical protein